MAAHFNTGQRDVADAVTNLLLNGLRDPRHGPSPTLDYSSDLGALA
jgi:hypothetical protein